MEIKFGKFKKKSLTLVLRFLQNENRSDHNLFLIKNTKLKQVTIQLCRNNFVKSQNFQSDTVLSNCTVDFITKLNENHVILGFNTCIDNY